MMATAKLNMNRRNYTYFLVENGIHSIPSSKQVRRFEHYFIHTHETLNARQN